MDECIPVGRPSIAARRGALLSWHDVNVEVPVTKPVFNGLIQRPTAETQSILAGVSGLVRPGTVTMIMGPSGSGKSTLLDALMKRFSGKCSGDIRLDAKPRQQPHFREQVKYLPQDDTFYAFLTVYETLLTAAKFYSKTGNGNSPKSFQQRAAEVMELVGLTEQAGVRIGGTYFRGLSGGQRRRLSIGIELLASPDVLVLDEPTTGLDSAAALSVVRVLRDIASTVGTTCILSIHQPGKDVLALSDNVLLLSKGRVAYMGPTHKAVAYFKGFGESIKQGQSASEFMLELINADFRDDQHVTHMLDAWDASAEQQDLLSEIDTVHSGRAAPGELGPGPQKTRSPAQSWFTDFSANLQRGLLETTRHPALAWARVVLYIGLGMIIGLIWLRLGRTSDNIYSLMTASAYTFTFFVFMSVAVIPGYLDEKRVTTREYSNGAYSASAFVTAHTLSMLPFLGIMALTGASVAYWMVNMKPDLGAFVFYVFTLFVSLAVSESVVFFLALFFQYYILAIGAAAALFAVAMVVMGGFIRERNITWVIRWIRYPSIHYWGHIAIQVSQFRGVTFPPPSTAPLGTPSVEGDFFLEVFGFSQFSAWTGIGVLLAFEVIMRVASTFAFRHVAK